MFFCIFSKQTCINSFDCLFYRYHLFKIAITTKFGIRLFFHANSVKIVKAMSTAEGKLIFVYHLTLIQAKAPWSMIKVTTIFSSFVCFIVLFISLSIGRPFNHFKVKSRFRFIVVFLYFLLTFLLPYIINQFLVLFLLLANSVHL